VPDGSKLVKPAAGKSWQPYSYQVQTHFAPCVGALTLPAAPNVTALWRYKLTFPTGTALSHL
jgi:hypothetical protein